VTTTDPTAPATTAPFSHGVASFDPTGDSVVLWTRAPGSARVRWQVARDHGAEPVAQGEAEVPAEHDHCVAVTVDGLDPATSYVYWFDAGPARSPVGRTRTLPDAGTEPHRLAVVCCGDYSRGHYTAYRAVAEADVDLVLHVGDYIYETRGKGDVRQALPDHELVSLDDYRTRYGQARADADLMALHQRHPMVCIWDDHDIADNAWRHGAKHHDPNEHGPWEDRLRAAATAHQEWLPARLRDPADPLTVYRSFAIGDLAEVVVLDTRIIGRDQHADDDPAVPYDDPRRSMLGDEQRAWAHERVRDTTRPWCLLVTQVVLNRMKLPVETGAKLGELAPSGYAVIDGHAMCTDEWDGYPAERDALVRVIAERGPGVVALSGDVHSAWAFEGPCLPGAEPGPDDDGASGSHPGGGDRPDQERSDQERSDQEGSKQENDDGDTPSECRSGDPVAVEFVAPCVTATPMARQLPAGWRKLMGKLAERLPEARWFELERHGFLVVDIDRDEARAHWYAVDTEDPAAGAELASAWRHRLARPGRLDPIDAAETGDQVLSSRSREAADRPQVDAPGRPDVVLDRVEPRRARRRRIARLAALAAAGAAAAAGVRARVRSR
jgi:alkaline phosphatase D